MDSRGGDSNISLRPPLLRISVSSVLNLSFLFLLASQSWLAPPSTATACGSNFAIASSDSTAPFGLPGKLIINALRRTTATPRESSAVGVFSAPRRRISSANPGITRSPTSIVASGVLSRGPSPVPPVVKSKLMRLESTMVRSWLRTPAGSSEQRKAEVTSQPSSLQRAASAGPERSSRSPRVTESLMVRMATRIGLVGADGVTIGFVHQAHRFHQQAGSAARGGDVSGSACRVEIDLEFAFGPQNYFEHGIIAGDGTHFRVATLATGEIQFGGFSSFAHHQAAGFLAHFQRLQQIRHVHFFQAALNHAGTRRALL